MSLLNAIKAAPPLRPLYNLGSLLDMSTGYYVVGKNGESILCGGLSHVTGVTGPGNAFKSVLGHFHIIRIMDRYLPAAATVYDTEGTVTINRFKQLALGSAIDLVNRGSLEDPTKFVITDVSVYDGTAYFAAIKAMVADRVAGKDKNLMLTPFIDPRTGKQIEVYPPVINEIDSFSLFQTATVNAMQEENDIGESGRNMEAMRDGHGKTQMLMELPALAAKASAHFILTAHLGDAHALNPREIPRKKLAFLRPNVKIKNVTEKFTFLTNNLWYCMGTSPLMGDDKLPIFPRNPDDDMKGDTDLVSITLMNLRPKNGPAGMPFQLVASQRDGILPSLSEYLYLKENNYFGIEGNNRTFRLALFPGLSMTRHKIRSAIDAEPRLRRALEITSELCQYYNFNPDLNPEMVCTPTQLYEDIKNKGYDWDRLLDTRGYWTFDHYDNPVPFLSTLDLLNMRIGMYHPWWYGELSNEHRELSVAA